LKGKAAIMIHQKCGRKRNFVGLKFWAWGYCVSTVGLDEEMVREYIRTQEEQEKKEEQIQLDYQNTFLAGPRAPLQGGFLKLPALRVVNH
jgi:hypothetical protein